MENGVFIRWLVLIWAGTGAVTQPGRGQAHSPAPAGRVEAADLSPTALAATAGGRTVYVACATAGRVLAYDPGLQTIVQEIAVPASPSGLVLAPDDSRLYVTCAAPRSAICIIDTAAGEVVDQFGSGHTTMAPVLSPDGGVLYVCHRFEHEVGAFDLVRRQELWRIQVSREPIAAAVTPDGRWLLVANHLHHRRSDEGVIGAVVSVIDTAKRCVARKIQLPRGSGLVRGVAISPDGKFAAVTHLMGRYYLSTTEVDFGRINGNAVSLIDLERLEWVRLLYLDYAGRGAANPWGVAWGPDGRSLLVTLAGTHEVSLVDVPPVPQKAPRVRSRIAVPGNGPRALLVSGTQLFVANYFSDNLCQMDLDEVEAGFTSIELGKGLEPSLARRGEMLFNDARLCYQHWQSCASCHDSDARADALNWDLLNDGVGNPKNAKSLLWAHRTPPMMALGVRGSSEAAVRAGIKHILFTSQPEEVPRAIDAYLASLEPVPSPTALNPLQAASVHRGQKVFQAAGCARCHPAPLFTDLRSHLVGTGRSDRAQERLDTPTLVELWRTAPYLHDGSAVTVRDVLTTRNLDDAHGNTSQLTAGEMDDLVTYLLSL